MMTMTYQRGRGRGRGFTLLELLMVIAVIGVLGAMLLPALAKAKGMARRAHCNGSQRQLVLAWNLYSTDHADELAPNGHSDPDQPGAVRTWVAGDSHFYLPSYTNSQYLVNPEYAAFGLYLPTASIYKCPEDRGMIYRSGVRGVPQIRSYAMNAYVGWATDRSELTPGYKVFTKSSDFAVDSPARVFVFQETHPNSICLPAFMTYMPGGEVDGFYHYPSALHRGGGVVTFADGHIENHRWVDARTRKPVTVGILAHWDASPGNPDVRWLQEHATRPVDAVALAAASAAGSSASSGLTGR